MRHRRITSLLALAPFALAFAAWIIATRGHLSASLGLDYEADAAASILALGQGHVASALSHQPLMGPLSIFLRAPFAALAPAGNIDAQYALGLIPCLAVTGAVVVWLRRAVARRWPEGRAHALLPWLLLASAPALGAVLYGHPEEVLGAALCLAAALAAIHERPVLCGVLLGLAVATKQWGWFALLPILAAGTGSRPKTALVAVGLACALTLPFAVADTAQFASTNRQVAVFTSPLTPLTAWALLSPGAGSPGVGLGDFGATLRAPGIASWSNRPLMALVILLVSALALARPLRRREDVLGLLALVFLARCALDPVDNVYYHAPLLFCLAGWEALRSPALPRLSLISAGVLGAVALSSKLDATLLVVPAVLYVAWALWLAVALGRPLLAPGRLATRRALATAA